MDSHSFSGFPVEGIQFLADICFEHCQRMDPIQRWLVKLDQRI